MADEQVLRAQLADLDEALRAWQGAAKDAAHTATIMADRLLEMEAVVKAAQAWLADRFNEHDGTPTAEALAARVDAYINQRKAAS